MHCDQAQPLLSIALDEPLGGEEAAALDDHVTTCEQCRSFTRHLQDLRRQLRFETVESVPDVAPAVLASLPPRPAPAWWSMAAALIVGAVVGASVVGFGTRQPVHVAAADVPGQVLQAQVHLRTLAADLTVVERGWHPDVPERRFEGLLRYAAPETVAVMLHDTTAYPSSEWPADDVTVVSQPEAWWSRARRGCPRQLLPGCLSEEVRTTVVTGREPFDPTVPAALDLVVPVRSFRHADAPALLGHQRIGGRAAVGVAVTAAQVAPLLDGLRHEGSWREIHPADRAEVWLDSDTFVPLAVDVSPSASAQRRLWAARRGFADPPDRPLLEVRLDAVRINEPLPTDVPAPPSRPATRHDAGFRPGRTDLDVGWLPPGMQPYRAGVTAVGDSHISVEAWTDGAAWLVVRRQPVAAGEREEGGAPPRASRQVALAGGATAFVSDGGARVTLTTTTASYNVLGSVDEATLLRVADGLGLRTVAPPAADHQTLRAALGGEVDGFGPPETSVEGSAVTLRYPGPGSRSFTLAQTSGERLRPPLDHDVVAVEVRGHVGRYSPRMSALEWVEDRTTFTLRSESLTLAEMVGVAAQLERP